MKDGESRHDRRLARRLAEDPEFAAEFHRQAREIAAIDGIVNQLDGLRSQLGLSKAQLARQVRPSAADGTFEPWATTTSRHFRVG